MGARTGPRKRPPEKTRENPEKARSNESHALLFGQRTALLSFLIKPSPHPSESGPNQKCTNHTKKRAPVKRQRVSAHERGSAPQPKLRQKTSKCGSNIHYVMNHKHFVLMGARRTGTHDILQQYV